MRVFHILPLAVALTAVVAAAPARADRWQAKDGGKVGNKYLGGKWSADAWFEHGATANGFGGKADAKLLLLTKDFNGFQGEAKVVGATARKPGEIVLFAKVARKTLVNERHASYLSVSKNLPPYVLSGSMKYGFGPFKIGLAGELSADATATIRATSKLLYADAYAKLNAGVRARVKLQVTIPDARVVVYGQGNAEATLFGDVRAEPTKRRANVSYTLSGGRFRVTIDVTSRLFSGATTLVDEDLGYKHGKLIDL